MSEAAPREDLIELEAHEHVIPSESSGCFRVAKGRLALYAVALDGETPVGQRHYLLTLHEGAVLAGARLAMEGRHLALLGVPMGAYCHLEQISPAVLLTGSEEGEAAWGKLKSLCSIFGRLLAKMTPATTYCERVGTEKEFEFSEGIAFQSPSRDPVWFDLDAGKVAIFDEDILEMDADAPLLPAVDGVWFKVREGARGNFQPFEIREAQPERAPEFFGGVMQLARLLLIRSREAILEQEKAEAQRLALLESQRANEHRTVVQNLSLDLGTDGPLEERETPLLTALGAIGRDIGVDFKTSENFNPHDTYHNQLEAIVRTSGTRLRRVKLDGAWWLDDVGTLLAFRKDGTPMAFMCRPRYLGMVREYEAIDPVAGTRGPVDEELADSLEEDAYTFVAPLPIFEDGVNPWEMSYFAIKPFLGDAGLLFLLSFAGSLLGLVMPMANMLMMDQVIPDANRNLIVDLAFGMSAVSIGLFVFSLSQGLITMRVQYSLTARLQASVIDRLLRLPNRFFRKYSSGDMLNRSMMINEISASFSSTVARSLMSLLSVGMMLVLCFYYNRRLAWLALISAALTSILSVSFSFMIKRIALRSEVESGKLFGFVVQMIHGVSKLQVAGAEGRAFAKWSERYGKLLRDRYRIDLLQQTSGVINGFIQMASTALLFYMAGRMVQESAAMQMVNPMAPPLITIGTFFAFQGAFSSVVGGIVGFFGTFVDLHQIMAKRELIAPILEAEVESSVEREDPGPLEGHLAMKNLVFRYQENLPLVLDKLSLEAYPGEFIAIVGPSGSGKSTLLKLMLGFEFPESGVVLYDGRDLSSLDLAAVRRQIGVVLQGGSLNAGTIFQIISGAKPISLDHAWAAAEEAGFAEDVKQMPMGMHTLLPEGAPTLSGGQRQRLTIARALALDPRIIYFDEATSALDNRTQEIVSRNLEKRKVTRIVVAHRLSTIRDANRIYVVDKGQVKESGSYEELMAEKGMFHRLAIRQLAEV